MSSKIRSFVVVAASLCAGLAVGQPAPAQSPSAVQETRNFQTRSQLEAAARTAQETGDERGARLINDRLSNGDFRDGDRVFVRVRGPAPLADTFVVRAGKVLQIPQMADLSLAGVLRSELTPRLQAHIAQYLRDPVVQATPLLRVGVLGSVASPGYYYVAADVPLSDVLMAAGGPTAQADVTKISVRREADVIIDRTHTRSALAAGTSLDMLHLEAGDEIEVGQKNPTMSWPMILSAATGVLGLLITYAVSR